MFCRKYRKKLHCMKNINKNYTFFRSFTTHRLQVAEENRKYLF